MKKLTHSEIKALPKGTKVLIKGIFDLADDNTKYPYDINIGGITESFSHASEIYLPGPELQPLPEKMPEGFRTLTGGMGNAQYLWAYVRENYGTAPREWWMDLMPGDKFIFGKDRTIIFNKVKTFLYSDRDEDCPFNFNVQDCRPYVEPTPEEAFIASLSPEQKEAYKKLKHG